MPDKQHRSLKNSCSTLPALLLHLLGHCPIFLFARVVANALALLAESASGGLLPLKKVRDRASTPCQGHITIGAHHRTNVEADAIADVHSSGPCLIGEKEQGEEADPLSALLSPLADLCCLKLLQAVSKSGCLKELADPVVSRRIASVLVAAYSSPGTSALAALAADLVKDWTKDKSYAEKSGGVHLPAAVVVLQSPPQGLWEERTRLCCLRILQRLAKHKLFSHQEAWLSTVTPLVHMVNCISQGSHAAHAEGKLAAKVLALLAQASDGDAFNRRVCQAGAILALVQALEGQGDSTMEAALEALIGIVEFGDQGRAAFAQEAGACSSVVNLLRREDLSAHCCTLAVELCRRVAADRACRRLLVQGGLIRALVHVLRSQPAAGGNAARVLGLFTRTARRAILEAEAVPPLVALLQVPQEGFDEQGIFRCASAANTLGLLAAVRDNRQAVTAVSTIPPLLRLMLEGPLQVREAAEDALCILAVDSQSAAQIMASLVPPLQEGTLTQKAVAADAIWTIVAAGHEQSASLIEDLPIISLLVNLLTSSDPNTELLRHAHDSASGALSVLSDDEDNVPIIVSSGAVLVLVDLLRDPATSSEAKECAAEILYKVCLICPEDGRPLVLAAGGVLVLGKVLTEGSATMIEYAAKALRMLETGEESGDDSRERSGGSSQMSDSDDSSVLPESLEGSSLGGEEDLEDYAFEGGVDLDDVDALDMDIEPG